MEALLSTLLFYLFSLAAVIAGVMVVSLKNPVHSVLSLIVAFFAVAWLFIMLGAEFISMLLIIVYAGAVAVLFLFVIMMMDINFAELRQGFTKFLPVGIIVALLFFLELFVMLRLSNFAVRAIPLANAPAPDTAGSNTMVLGKILYTDYFLAFQVAGLVLLVAMIGAIVLTLRHKEGVRRQRISGQVSRSIRDSIKVVKVESGRGI